MAALALVSALFALGLAHHVVADSLCCADDSFIAVAAKNLATGHGYASSYAPTPRGEPAARPFDPLISTGPVLVVPAAAGIAIFGPRYWVPGAAMVAIVLLLLGALAWRFAVALPGSRRWAPAFLVALVALNLATLGYYEQWYALLGEIPALLLVALGVLLLLDARGRGWDHAAGGLLLGLAVQSKTLALLALPVALAFLVLAELRREPGEADEARPSARGGRSRWRRALTSALIALAFCAVPTLLFEGAKLATLGPAAYRQASVHQLAYLARAPGSGLGPLFEGGLVRHLHATVARNWQALTRYFGSPWAVVASLAALVLGLAARRRWSGREPAAPLALAAIAALYASWWLAFSGRARIRYLLIGLGLWCLGAALDLFLGRPSARKALLACALALALLPRVARIGSAWPQPPLFAPGARATAMLATAHYLEAHRRGRVVAADWWATGADMEYLLDGTGNLVHFLSLRSPNPPAALLLENTRWLDLVPAIRTRWDESLVRFRARLVFDRPPYRVWATPPFDTLNAPVGASAP